MSFAEIRRLIRFGVVGFSGVFVNLLVSEALFRVFLLPVSDPTTRLGISNASGVVVSIFTNFVLNDRWTWGDRNKGSRLDWWKRLGKYYVAASAAGAVQVGVATVTFDHLLQDLRIAEIPIGSTVAICVGIGAAMVINFVASHFWAFKDAENK